MIKPELNYQFRERLLEVHKRGMRDDAVWTRVDGLVVTEEFEIVCGKDAGRVARYAAYDLMEYFRDSLDMYLRVRESDDIRKEALSPAKRIVLIEAKDAPEWTPSSEKPAAHRVLVSDDGVIICGRADRGVAQGCYFLEDRMNAHCGPVLTRGAQDRAPLFSPRMVHSGYGLDMYPDNHIRAIAHAGMDALLVFVKDVDKTPHGYVDFNELIHRAAGYGVDVYAYSYLISRRHPDDPDARAHYESTYGRLFERCPGFKGVVLVGESCEFPSKDPRVTPHPYYEVTKENNPFGLPSPGWFPCDDYPQWVEMVRDVVRGHKPDADFVFWTYNWGYVNEADRLKLIRALPTDITLQATYEMFEKFDLPGNVREACTDYTLFFEGPGRYFASEAAEAKKRGIRLYAMTNTGGLTWDVGVVPYEPCPDQWNRRYDGLLRAHEAWGLEGLMESHHYGFWPSFVSEIAKRRYWSPTMDYAAALREIAVRDYGEAGAERAIDALHDFSEGIRNCISTNEDQYGPFRIGPAYPLLYLEEAEIPSVDYAHFGHNRICNPMYRYDLDKIDSLRYEIDCVSRMRDLFERGARTLRDVAATLTGRRLDDALRLAALGEFMSRAARTTVNVKKWYLEKCDLLAGRGDRAAIIARMRAIGEAEIANVEATIPLVEADSRLGFEPSMEYMCDRAHLQWKIDCTRRAMAALDMVPAGQTQSSAPTWQGGRGE